MGSVAVHAVVLAAAATLMAATALEQPVAKTPKATPIAVDLVMLPEELDAGVTPPPPRPAPERKTASAPAKTITAPTQGPTTAAPSARADEDAVYLGPPSVLIQPDAPPGLASVMGNDPCAVTHGPKPRECVGRELAKRTGPMDSMLPRSQAQLEQHFAAFMPKCTLRVGCEPQEWISSIGTRTTGRPPPGSPDDRGAGTPGAGGAASIGGLSDSVGRLGFNADHRDPGFGD